MSYVQLIRETPAAAGRLDRVDLATAALVEELMRTNPATLDYLTPAAFRSEVLVALSDAEGLNAIGRLEMYCEAVELARPTWA